MRYAEQQRYANKVAQRNLVARIPKKPIKVIQTAKINIQAQQLKQVWGDTNIAMYVDQVEQFVGVPVDILTALGIATVRDGSCYMSGQQFDAMRNIIIEILTDETGLTAAMYGINLDKE